MTTQVGIWIDHRAARLAWLAADAEASPTITTVEADVESRHRSFGGAGTTAPGHLGGNVESRYQRRRGQQLDRFYRSVVEAIRNATEVVLLGPAEARGELARVLEEDKSLRLEIVASERCDQLTDPQLIQTVKDAFDRHHAGRP